MSDLENIKIALDNYFRALSVLKGYGLIPNQKDFTGQLGEWFVSEVYGGTRSTNGIEKDWDVKIGDKLVQVKTHAKAETTTARFSFIKKILIQRSMN